MAESVKQAENLLRSARKRQVVAKSMSANIGLVLLLRNRPKGEDKVEVRRVGVFQVKSKVAAFDSKGGLPDRHLCTCDALYSNS